MNIAKVRPWSVGALGALAAAGGCTLLIGVDAGGDKPAGTGGGTSSTSGPSSATASGVSSVSSSTTTSTTGSGSGGGTGGGMPGGGEVWGKGFQTIGADLPSPTGIAVDKQGNAYVIGYYGGTITFAQGPGGSLTSAGGSACSYFLASFDKAGTYRWGTSFDAIGNQCQVSDFSSVAVDAQGNVYFAGDLSIDSVQVGPTNYPNPSGGTNDALLLASYTSTGTLRWSRVDANAYPTGLGADSKGNLLVTGVGAPAIGAMPPGVGTMFLAKFEAATGTGYWSSVYGDAAGQPKGTQSPNGLVIDAADDVLITGSFLPSIKLDTTSFVTLGGSDIFLAKFYTGEMWNATVVWANRYGGAKNDSGYSVAVDPSGAISLVGTIAGPADLGGGNMVVNPLSYTADGFVARYEGVGTFSWAKTFGGTLGVTSQQVASDVNGNVIVAGAGAGSFDFGGGGVLTPAGPNPNVYLAKFDTKGKYHWAKLFGDTNGQQYPVVATDPTTHEVVLAFANQGKVNLGKDTITAMPLGNAHMSNLVVARFNP